MVGVASRARRKIAKVEKAIIGKRRDMAAMLGESRVWYKERGGARREQKEDEERGSWRAENIVARS